MSELGVCSISYPTPLRHLPASITNLSIIIRYVYGQRLGVGGDAGKDLASYTDLVEASRGSGTVKIPRVADIKSVFEAARFNAVYWCVDWNDLQYPRIVPSRATAGAPRPDVKRKAVE
jgi:hypothetical protein